MKKLFLLLMVLALPLGAQDTGWTIKSFDTEYSIKSDRTVDVVETIVVDFGNLRKRGIFRDIEVVYQKKVEAGISVPAQKTKSEITDIWVTDENGQELTTRVTDGRYINIRIGDENIYLSGVQTYAIHYTIHKALGFFDDHDELYWQVTGTDWPVPILSASASVTLPATGGTGNGTWGVWCYAGWPDSNDGSRCTAESDNNGSYKFTMGTIQPGEGFTVVAGFPKGIIPAPTWLDNLKELLATFWPLFLPMMVFGMMYRKWQRTGRDPPAKSVVPNWKIPSDIPAGLAGTLFDQSADMDDLVAIILELGVSGYIKIRELPPESLFGKLDESSFLGRTLKSLGLANKDWELERINRQGEDNLVKHERLLMEGIFGGGTTKRMSELSNHFYTHIPGIKSSLYEELAGRGLYAKNPNKVRGGWVLLGGLSLIVGITIGLATQNFVLLAMLTACGVIVLSFAPFMPARTLKGADVLWKMKGLQEYIRRAEKDELERYSAPEKTLDLFEKMLPYAVALHVSGIWVKEFAGVLEATPPNWYVGNYPGRFDAGSFSDSLSGFQTATTRTLGSSPGSSSGSGGGGGGGSVGGGGGGGGGGSW